MRMVSVAVLFAFFMLPLPASAQSIENLVGSVSPFSVSLSPKYPAPLAPVSLSFLSSSIDLANSTLLVSVGGKQLYQGSVQPVAVMMGKAGSVASVTMTITSAGKPYTQTLVLQPQEVSLIAEPLASAHVLYPGKPLVPLGGNTRIIAIANFADASGKTIDPAALSYLWTVEGAEIANSSGIGKQSIIVASPLQYRIRPVSVLVQSQMGNLVGQASLTLSPQQPSIRLYENDPLLGVRFGRALSGAYTIRGTEASIYAAPFSVPLSQGSPALQWFLNGARAKTGSLITLRPTGNGQGSASLSIKANGPKDTFSEANTSLSLTFGKAGSNFFGL